MRTMVIPRFFFSIALASILANLLWPHRPLLAASPEQMQKSTSCVSRFQPIVEELLAPLSNETLQQALVRAIRQHGETALLGWIPGSEASATIAFYPAVGPLHAIREAKDIIKQTGMKGLWKVPFRILRKDGATLVGLVTVHYINGKIIISQVDYDQETHDFKSELGSGIYVMADLVPRDNRLANVPEFEFKKNYKMFPKTQFVRATSLQDLISQLRKIRSQQGPITGLVIYAHGAPGLISTPDGDVTEDFIRYRIPWSNDLFTPDGRILINSCSSGASLPGDSFTRTLGNAFLEKGGTVYSSQVSIISNSTPTTALRMGVPMPIANHLGTGLNQLADNYPILAEANLFRRLIVSMLYDIPLFPKNRVRTTHIEPH